MDEIIDQIKTHVVYVELTTGSRQSATIGTQNYILCPNSGL